MVMLSGAAISPAPSTITAILAEISPRTAVTTAAPGAAAVMVSPETVTAPPDTVTTASDRRISALLPLASLPIITGV